MTPKCPRCAQRVTRRIGRQSPFDRLCHVLALEPYRCQICGRRFRAFSLRSSRSTPDRRQYERLMTRIGATIMGKPGHGDGVVTELSAGGCKIVTETPLGQDAFLHLKLQASDQLPAVTIQNAMVRTVHGNCMGLEFLALDPRQRQYLSRWIGRMLGRDGSGRGTDPSEADRGSRSPVS